MADDVTVDGTAYVVATDDVGGEHAQLVKLAYSADGSRVHAQLDADGLLVNLGGNNDVTVAVLPLPSGAATAAKQPALGAAGAPSADVVSIQGVASGTVVPVSDAGGSLTVDVASLPLPSGASTAAAQATIVGHLDGVESVLGTIDADTSILSGAVREPARPAPTRTAAGRVLYVEDFRALQPGLWNDALGSAARDCNVMFNGKPTMRLDTQGNRDSGSPSSPGRTANVSGVIVKRRIHDGYRIKVGVEGWFRFTSTNLTSNTYLSMSVYNRNGTNAHHARVWLDLNGNNQPILGKILDGAATNTLSGTTASGTPVYTTVTTSVQQNGGGSHTYEPASGRGDRAGGWHWVKLVVNFATLKYVSIQLDGETAVDLSAYDLDVTTSTGFAGMHHSWEFMASTTTRPRYVNIAQIIGTVEP